MTKRVIILKDGARIEEKQRSGMFEYYFHGEFIFGTLEPWTQESLQHLYNIGYFNIKGEAMRESLKRAQAEYMKKCKIFSLRVNKETESDIIDWLAQPRAGSRLKALIRANIRKGK